MSLGCESATRPAPGPSHLPTLAVLPPTRDSFSTEEFQTALDDLHSFYRTAPERLGPKETLVRHNLLTGEAVSCVRWKDRLYITSTDIIRGLVFRFQAMGRPVRMLKKFEEGVFSDLRNLKSGVDATLEEPRSDFLELLYKHQCIRTQKKQRVFHWHAVKHDYLFQEAYERDLKRVARGTAPTTSSRPGSPTAQPQHQPETACHPHDPSTPGLSASSTTSDPSQSPLALAFSHPTARSFKPPPDVYHHITANGSTIRVPHDALLHLGHDEDDNDVLSELQAVNSEMSLSEPSLSLCLSTSYPSGLLASAAAASNPSPPYKSQHYPLHPGSLYSEAFGGPSDLTTHHPVEPTWACCPLHSTHLSPECPMCQMALQASTTTMHTPADPPAKRRPSPSVEPQGQAKRPRITCPQCSREFTRLEGLRRHMTTHGASKTFRCSVSGCLSHFDHLEALNTHIQLQHSTATHGRSLLPGRRPPPPLVLSSSSTFPLGPASAFFPSSPFLMGPASAGHLTSASLPVSPYPMPGMHHSSTMGVGLGPANASPFSVAGSPVALSHDPNPAGFLPNYFFPMAAPSPGDHVLHGGLIGPSARFPLNPAAFMPHSPLGLPPSANFNTSMYGHPAGPTYDGFPTAQNDRLDPLPDLIDDDADTDLPEQRP